MKFAKMLSRNEMKNIMAGDDEEGGECALYCDGCTIRCGVSPCSVQGDHMHCNGETYDCSNC